MQIRLTQDATVNSVAYPSGTLLSVPDATGNSLIAAFKAQAITQPPELVTDDTLTITEDTITGMTLDEIFAKYSPPNYNPKPGKTILTIFSAKVATSGTYNGFQPNDTQWYWNGLVYNQLLDQTKRNSFKNNQIAFFGDSLAMGQFFGVGMGPFTVTNGIATHNGAFNVDLAVGVRGFLIRPATSGIAGEIYGVNSPIYKQIVVTEVTGRGNFKFGFVGQALADGTYNNISNWAIYRLDQKTGRNVIFHLNGYTGGYFDPVWASCQNGLRVDELYSTFFADLLLAVSTFPRLGWAFINIGANSTNGLDTFGTVDVIWQQTKEMIDYAVSLGLRVIVRTVPAVNSSLWARTIPSNYHRALKFNARIRQYASENRGTVFVSDLFRAQVDTANANGDTKGTAGLSGYIQADGLHPTTRSAHDEAYALYKQLSVDLPQAFQGSNIINQVQSMSALESYLGMTGAASFAAAVGQAQSIKDNALSFCRQIISNPNFAGAVGGTGSAGVAGGTPPTGWNQSVSGANVTATLATAARADGYGNQITETITFGAGAGTTDYWQLQYPSTVAEQQNMGVIFTQYAGKKYIAGYRLSNCSFVNVGNIWGRVGFLQTVSNIPAEHNFGETAQQAGYWVSTAPNGDYWVLIAGEVPTNLTFTDLVLRVYSSGGAGVNTLTVSSPFLVILD